MVCGSLPVHGIAAPAVSSRDRQMPVFSQAQGLASRLASREGCRKLHVHGPLTSQRHAGTGTGAPRQRLPLVPLASRKAMHRLTVPATLRASPVTPISVTRLCWVCCPRLLTVHAAFQRLHSWLQTIR